jgi:GT2 family glycosyltransferase
MNLLVDPPSVAVLIPTYNRFEVTNKCTDILLESIDNNFIIVICDSNSSDSTPSLWRKANKIHVINVGGSEWWSGAVNAGIEFSLNLGISKLILLNDDITFDPSLIDDLIMASATYPDCIISPSQVAHDGIYMGSRYLGFFKKCKNFYLSSSTKRDIEVDTSNGCCLLIPANIFMQVGLINDVNCPHLYGDTEFQIRAKKKGFKTIACANIVISQDANTDYLSKINFNNFFSSKGSPFLISAHIAFNKALYGNRLMSLICGFNNHFAFLKSAIKNLIKLSYKKLSDAHTS